MQLKLITVSFDPDTGAFPVDPLADVPGEVVSVVEHFFTHGDRPRLLLVVHFEPRSEVRAPTRSRGRDRARPEDALAPHERELYGRLRAWRNARGQAEGVPPYALLTNAQLVEVVRLRPDSVAALQGIRGIGEKKTARFGEELLVMLRPPQAADAAALPPAAVQPPLPLRSDDASRPA